MLRNYFSLIPLNIGAIVCFGVPLGLEKVKHIHLLLGDCASGHCSGGDAEGSSGSCVPSEGKLGLAGYACVDAALCESGKCVNDSCEGGAGYLTAGQYFSDQPHNTRCSPKQRRTPNASVVFVISPPTHVWAAQFRFGHQWYVFQRFTVRFRQLPREPVRIFALF